MSLVSFNASTGSVWMEAAWADTNCRGSPASMKIFSVQNAQSLQQNQDQWPLFYSLVINQSGYLLPPVSRCGSFPGSLPDNCCISAVKGTTSDAASASDYLLPSHVMSDKQLGLYSPKGAANSLYCYLILASPSYPPVATSALFGYQGVLYTADGSCVDSHTPHPVRCFANGTIAFYSQTQCQGASSNLQLVNPQVEKLSPGAMNGLWNEIVGEVAGKMINITDAQQTTSWTTYQPDYLVTSTLDLPLEVLSLAAFIVGLAGGFGAAVWSIWQFSRRPSTMWLVLGISQLLWTLFYSLKMASIYTLFHSNLQYVTIWNSMNYLQCTATLSATVYSSLYFNHAARPTRTVRMAQLGILAGLHIGLSGGVYLSVIRPNPAWVVLWRSYFKYWIAVYFSWTIVPLVALVQGIVSTYRPSKDPFDSVRKAMRLDWAYCVTVCSQLLLVVGYYVLGYFRTETIWLGNDRAYSVKRCLFILGC
ncbi:hypothetical protein HDU91_005300 [Kappamyces sp. JEL0680]|nr:hypothetical protein HDU91_005300 [Kappamyces sp. JEL0680]